MFSNKTTGRRTRNHNYARQVVIPDIHTRQTGFTLLEILVTVGILATVAGTATMSFKDTEVQAASAVHAAMIDELDKGVRSYRVLNNNRLPSSFDSLLQSDTISVGATENIHTNPQLYSQLATDSLAIVELTDPVAKDLRNAGLSELLYIAKDQDPDGEGDCQDIKSMVENNHNKVVAGSVYQSQAANGCGKTQLLRSGDKIAIWTGGYERVIGGDGAGFDDSSIEKDIDNTVIAAQQGAPVYMAVGAGPSSNLFNANSIGGMTTVPVNRNMLRHQYNRFILLFDVGVFKTDGTIKSNPSGIALAAVVTGAGTTAQEELGLFDY